ncbi:MAG: GGDEF domain-containing protein [Oscillospiraceae bacterium]|nr:GGDEF domain-containing protein [Oscillospiraceae bacterium]
MGIFRFTRQNHVLLSDDWKLFAGLFHNIGVFTFKDPVQTVFFDENAMRILNVPKSLSREDYHALLAKLMEEPVEGEQNLYLLRSGSEKRFLRLHLTRRADEELGFVEEIKRRASQQSVDQVDFDEITSLPRLSAFSRIVQRRMPDCRKLWIAALHIAGLDKVADFSVSGSSNYCMASVAEVLGRFAGEQVMLGVKGFQDFYVCFVDMDEQNVRLQLQQMRSAVSECIISDNFGQTIQTEQGNNLDLRAGIALYPEESDTMRGLLSYAEFALFETQHDSRNVIKRFSLEDFERKKDEYRDEQRFNAIINENRLTYHFQPIVDAHNGGIIGYEALMRSEHFVPEELLQLAERYDRLYDIERATLFNLMDFLAKHQSNFSGRALFINSIPTHLLTESDWNELLVTYQELFGRTVIEITEQSEGSEEMLVLLRQRCKETGARLAIDDYGSGYANTATLLVNMPNYVKIDRALIDGICKNTKKQQLVAGIIDYAHDNQITVLAEGVEEEADLKTLIRMGVDLFQGFYTARPTPYLLEEISEEVRNVIINTNLEAATCQKKIYNAHNDKELNLLELALEKYTDIHIYRHQLTLIGDPDRQVPMHIAVMDNHSCELTLRDVNIISQEKPCISIGSYAQLTLIAEGRNLLGCMGIRVPEGAFFHLMGKGDLTVDSHSRFGWCIGGDCDHSYGNITLESEGRVELICNADRGIGIGGGSNPDDSEICLESGDIHVTVASPNAVGIGCNEGNALIYANEGCKIAIEINGISSVGIGALTGEAQVRCSADVNFSGGGSKVIGIGVLNKGTGSLEISDAKLDFFVRTNFGACIGTIGGEVDVTVTNCKIEVNAEGGEITGIGDAKGSGNVILDHTELKAYIMAAKPHEAGSRGGQLIMRSSSIIADINDKHNDTTA